MDRELAAAEPPEGLADDITSARWRSLCERFHDIRLGAYRHNLVHTWRELSSTDPDAPGLLAEWELLDEQILVLDAQETAHVTRHWNGDAADSEDDWDDEGDEYVCPAGRCDRQLRSFLGVVPRCELFRREMAPHPIRPQPG